MLLQLTPSIPVYTKLGKGRALLVIDYGMDHNSCWVVALDRTGIIKHLDSNDVVLQENETFGTRNEGLGSAWKE